jgi:hypothetical protein
MQDLLADSEASLIEHHKAFNLVGQQQGHRNKN